MNPAETLIKLIDSGALLEPTALGRIDVECALASRDGAAFERRWLALFQELEKLEFTDSKANIDALREKAAKTVYTICKDPDLAGYVSDDFDVLAKGMIALPGHTFLCGMLETYAAGLIPGEGTMRQGRRVQEILSELGQRFIR